MDRIANEIHKKKERENRELDQEKRKKMVTKIVSMKVFFFFFKSKVGVLFVYLCLYFVVSACFRNYLGSYLYLTLL